MKVRGTQGLQTLCLRGHHGHRQHQMDQEGRIHPGKERMERWRHWGHPMGRNVGCCDAALTFSPLGPAGPGGPMGPVRPYGRERDEDVVSVSILCQPTPWPCPTYTCAILAWSSLRSFLTNISLWDGMSVSRAETRCHSGHLWDASPYPVTLGASDASCSSLTGHSLQPWGTLGTVGAGWTGCTLKAEQ